MALRKLRPRMQRRHLVLLVDGTGATAAKLNLDSRHSNVYKLNLALRNHNDKGEAQIAFYIPGIGSSSTGSRIAEEALARGLMHDVEQAYINLCSNYYAGEGGSSGDAIYLFGFSRGAVIVRLVAAIISRFGLLYEQAIGSFDRIWQAFLGLKSESEIESILRDSSYRNLEIEFVGAFDTVLGFYGGKYNEQLTSHFWTNRLLPRKVKRALHLLAINESRELFRPVLWSDIEGGGPPTGETTLEQIWMPGVHTDVGGGYPEDFLSNVALITMLLRIREHTDLEVNSDYLERLQSKVAEMLEPGLTEIVVNDEKTNTLFFELFKIRSDRGWRTLSSLDKFQYVHPVCKMMESKLIRIASAEDAIPYRLGVCGLEPAVFTSFLANQVSLKGRRIRKSKSTSH